MWYELSLEGSKLIATLKGKQDKTRTEWELVSDSLVFGLETREIEFLDDCGSHTSELESLDIRGTMDVLIDSHTSIEKAVNQLLNRGWLNLEEYDSTTLHLVELAEVSSLREFASFGQGELM